MTRVFAGIFYMALAVFVFQRGRFFLNLSEVPTDYVMAAYPLNWLPASGAYLPLGFFVALAVCSLASVFQKRWILVLASGSYILFVSLLNSFGKINHSHHALLFFSLLIPFIELEEPAEAKRNLSLIRICQAVLLSFYFSSGLWKIRGLGFGDWTASLKENIANSAVYNRGPHEFIVNNFVLENTWILTSGFILVALFQILCVVPVLKPKLNIHFGILACLFHLLTGSFMGIWMPQMFFAAFFILIFTEVFFLKPNSEQNKIS